MMRNVPLIFGAYSVNMNWIKAAMAFVIVCALFGCAEEKIPPGIDGYPQMDVSQVMSVYAQLSGKTVIFSKDVAEVHKVISVQQPKRPITRSEARKLLEDDLREQAGIVKLREDRKHVVFGFPATGEN